jgi:hypothetical protein
MHFQVTPVLSEAPAALLRARGQLIHELDALSHGSRLLGILHLREFRHSNGLYRNAMSLSLPSLTVRGGSL